MSKALRKTKRKMKLCKNKRYTINKPLTIKEIEEIEFWCEENLTNTCTWIKSQTYLSHTMGFHDPSDMVAFILRWG